MYDHTKKHELLRPCRDCGDPAVPGTDWCYGCSHAPAPPGQSPRQVEWTVIGIGLTVILAAAAAAAMVLWAAFAHGT